MTTRGSAEGYLILKCPEREMKHWELEKLALTHKLWFLSPSLSPCTQAVPKHTLAHLGGSGVS